MRLQNRFIFFAVVLVFNLTGVAPAKNKKELVAQKSESPFVKYEINDLSQHGISLIAPSDPTFTKGKNIRFNPYSVILKNNSSRPVVGYSISWECFDATIDSVQEDRSYGSRLSNMLGVVFLYGEESDRRAILDRIDGVVRPDSTWLISDDSDARPISGAVEEVNAAFDDAAYAEIRAACPIMTVTLDGVFFDDGTFVGPDATNFFAEVKTQIDTRYEIYLGVRNELKSGKNPGEVFKGLEEIRDQEETHAGSVPHYPDRSEVTLNQVRLFYRNMSARDVLGMREVWGPDRAIEMVEQMWSRPWVKPRKL